MLLMGHLVMAEPASVTTSSAVSAENAIEYSELKNIPIHPFAAAQESKLENNMQKYFDAELIQEAYQKK